jgi:hypothetical protein
MMSCGYEDKEKFDNVVGFIYVDSISAYKTTN